MDGRIRVDSISLLLYGGTSLSETDQDPKSVGLKVSASYRVFDKIRYPSYGVSHLRLLSTRWNFSTESRLSLFFRKLFSDKKVGGKRNFQSAQTIPTT